MANSRIIYNSRAIDLGVAPQELQAVAQIARIVNTTLTGRSEVVYLPRMDVAVRVIYRDLCDASTGVDAAALRVKLENWWQWAQKGLPWAYALDSSRTVQTTLAGAASAGATSVTVASATGIASGRNYVLTSGADYQMVYVTNVAGAVLTLSVGLDFDFSGGAVFRDAYYWPAIIRNADQESPIVDAEADRAAGRRGEYFDLNLFFFESVGEAVTAPQADAGAGFAAGTSTVLGVGAAMAAAVGTAAGTSTVLGVSAAGSVGTAAGTSTVTGVGSSTAAAPGTAAGTSSVIGISEGEAAPLGMRFRWAFELFDDDIDQSAL